MNNWHIDLIAETLERVEEGSCKRLIINLPPRQLKSVICSVSFPAWLLARDPSKTIMCVSYGQNLASKFSRDCQRIMEAPWYRAASPGVVISKSTEDTIETTMGGGRIAGSFGGPITGLGADYIIIDDPMKPEDAVTEIGRERTMRIFRETLISRLNQKAVGRIVVVMQRLHEADLSGQLLATGRWERLVFPAIAPEAQNIALRGGRTYSRKTGEALHPDREPLSVLEDVRRDLGSRVFEAQYNQNPLPSEGGLIKREWLQRYKSPLDRTGMKIIHSWDTAQKSDSKSDYSVCTVWGQTDRYHYHYLLDVYRERLGFPDLIKAVTRLSNRDNPSIVLIEDHGSGISLIQQLAPAGISAIPVKARDSKPARLNTATPAFERKEVLLPGEAPWLIAFEHELLGFPNTKHDDQVDSVSQYLNYALTRERGTFEADFGFNDAQPTHDQIADHLLKVRFMNPWT